MLDAYLAPGVTGDALESQLSSFYRRILKVEYSPVILYAQVAGPVQPARSPVATPCFLSHNTDDDVVDVRLGRSLRDSLRRIGMEVKWDEHEKGGPYLKHWIKEPEAVDNLIAFLESQMGAMRE